MRYFIIILELDYSVMGYVTIQKIPPFVGVNEAIVHKRVGLILTLLE